MTHDRDPRYPASLPDPELTRLVDRTMGLQPWRRVFHALSGIAIVAGLLWYVQERAWQLAILGGLALLLYLGDSLRLRVPALNRLFFTLFLPLASPREMSGPASSTWYALGIFLTVLLFPLEIAVVAILVLSLADPAASVVGRLWGRRPLGKGSWEGSVAFALVAAPILIHQGGMVGGLAATLLTAAAEVAPLRLDDNLVVPLAAGGSLLLAGALGL